MKKALLITSCFVASIFLSSCEDFPTELQCCAAYHNDGCWKADADTAEECEELIDVAKGEYCECYCNEDTVDSE